MAQDPADAINQLLQAIDAKDANGIEHWASVLSAHTRAHPACLQIPLSRLFAGFELVGIEASNLLARLIWDLVHEEDFPVIIELYSQPLLLGLQSGQERLIELCLDVLFKLGHAHGHGACIPDKLNDAALGLLLTSHHSSSAKVVQYICELDKRHTQCFVRPLLELYPQAAQHDSVTLFRMLQLCGELGISDDISRQSLLDAFVTKIDALIADGSDPLTQLVAFQTLSDCIHGKAEFSLLVRTGLVGRVLAFLPGTASQTISNPMIVTRALDFVAHCASTDSLDKTFIKESNLIDRIGCCLARQEEDIVASAVYVSSLLAARCELIELTPPLLLKFGNLFLRGSPTVQLTTLAAIGIVFISPITNFQSYDIKTDFLLYLEDYTSRRLIEYIADKALSTFHQQKLAAYSALRGLFSFPPSFKMALGSLAMKNLLNREHDSSPMGLKLKYSTIEMIVARPDLFELLDASMQEQMQRHLRQGVFFVPSTTRVASQAAD